MVCQPNEAGFLPGGRGLNFSQYRIANTQLESMDMNIEASRDAEGYLVNPADWDESMAKELAGEESVETNETFWSAMNFIRDYHAEHDINPDVRHLISYLAVENECSKREAKKLVFGLFPYGYVKQACKIAGMKKPRAWSTG